MNQSNDTRYKHCSICSQLKDYEYGSQKVDREEDDKYLPAAANKLILVKDLKPHGGDRLLHLEQCPECGTYYLYKTDYEYLVNGTEDEQDLTRLTDAEAIEYLSAQQ